MTDEQVLLYSDNLSVVRRTRQVRGEAQSFDIVRRPEIVIGVLTDEASGALVLVRQHREPIGLTTLEFPAGKVDSGEDATAAMRREVAEETGMSVARLDLLGRLWTAPHFTDELAHVFTGMAHPIAASTPTPQEELYGLLLVPPETIDARIADGTLRDSKSIAAWTLWRSIAARGQDNA